MVDEVQDNRQFQASSHSMVYFLLVLMRCLDEIHYRKVLFKKGTPDEKRISCFMMDHMVKYAELIPDEILPPLPEEAAIHQQCAVPERNQPGRAP